MSADRQVDASIIGTVPLPTNAAKETGGNLDAIKTDVDKIPSQGQALAAASMPVVLPATQITTLTPPAAITGFALEAGHLSTIDTSTAATDTDLKAGVGVPTDAESFGLGGTVTTDSASTIAILKRVRSLGFSQEEILYQILLQSVKQTALLRRMAIAQCDDVPDEEELNEEVISSLTN